MQDLSPDLGPDVVILGDLENLFGPTRFSHRTHAEMAAMTGGCQTCHHNSPVGSAHPACKTCHTEEINKEDPTQPGLRGVYHRLCLKCHSDWNADTGCENCHAKKGTGIAPKTALTHTGNRMTSATTVKDLIIFETQYKPGDSVPFHHAQHSKVFGYTCADCHEKQGCKACHGANLQPKAIREPHKHSMRLCFECHAHNSCDHCHGRAADDLFQHPPVKSLKPAVFTEMTCRSCHGHAGPYKREIIDEKSLPTPKPGGY
ncbi:MAG: cytochrome c3 family protein [bacterium]